MVLDVAPIDVEIRVLAVEILLCFVVSLEGVLELVKFLEIRNEVAEVGVTKKVPGGWIFHIEHDGSLDDLEGLLNISSSLLLVPYITQIVLPCERSKTDW